MSWGDFKTAALSSIFSSWDRLWYLRGIAIAFFAIKLVSDQLTSLTRYEFLRFTHAIMVLWNEIAATLGRWIGVIPWFPALDDAQVNSLMICVAVMLPPAVQVFAPRQPFTFYLRWSAYLLVFLPVMFLWFTMLFRDNSPIMALIFISIAAYSSFRGLLRVYPSYGRGIFTCMTFFAAIEAMYALQLPIISEWANDFACKTLEVPDHQCRIEN